MRVIFDPRQTEHAPERELHNGAWAPYAEVPARAESIAALFDCQPARDFGMAPLEAVHAPEYLQFLQDAWTDWQQTGRGGDAIPYAFPVRRRRALSLERIDARMGRHAFDAATPIARDTWKSAYWSAQTALTALEDLLTGTQPATFALCRPPGHHSGHDYMGGYCYLNSAAIAARHALSSGAKRVAVLDVDYHHGNGTQDIFYESADVFFASIHADPSTDYPFYWGHADECGAGEGQGTTLNVPLPRGTQWNAYRDALAGVVERLSAWKPELVVVSFGADTFAGDPISEFLLRTEDYEQMAQLVATIGVPILVVMEGGYAIGDLGANTASFLAGIATAL
ncbi:histone deacetylase family protein [Aurantiacibacter zhengii]|uniref:Histone deacetylase family protein n=1 Tax=Aurantiacibacter zhengii TaxID=2307003 RepID=A0A418NQY1_9SPHN|nr:histone deacetylase family protein [Aurantiacibacter zhengii]RIV84992.1 histone deacetylase family protein [Aurantiacibacter zhengii]